jgi:hypothetical protein
MEINNSKKLGIWLDNSEAHLMEYTDNDMITTIIKSAFTHEVMEESLAKNENLMHNKKQQQQGAYLKEIAGAIKNYEEVLLFGPTEAKIKLEHLLKADRHFSKVKIHTKQTDYMTENQQHAYVKHFYSTNLI